MKVLVTGATGFLGEHLVRALIEREHEVTALARHTSRTALVEELGAKVFRAGFEEEEALRRACDGNEVVVHAAGGGISRRSADIYRGNTASTVALAAAAERAGVRRFVLVSSLAAHGGSRAGRPARESDADDPKSHYGRSKLAAERALMRTSLEVTMLRPPALYGPGEHRMVALFRAAERGLVPTVFPEGTLSMLHGADCAEVLVSAVEADAAHGVLYVAEPRVYTRRRMAELVGAAVGRRVRVLSLPPILPRGASVLAEASAWVSRRPVFLTRDKVRDILEPHQSCVPERAERALGWSATRRFDGGAREAYLDYRRRGWL